MWRNRYQTIQCVFFWKTYISSLNVYANDRVLSFAINTVVIACVHTFKSLDH